jgi:hypothetical protein
MSNPSMPNIYKIGNIFDKTPEESLALINKAYPHALTTEYKYEIIKKVSDIFSEQEKLYDLLNEHTSRTNTDYFSGSLIIIREIFKLIKSIKPIEEKKYYRKKLHHDMRKCFISDQLIRHNIKKRDSTWIGVYNSVTNTIDYNGTKYNSLTGFATAHLRIYNPDCKSVDGWECCKYDHNGSWVSTNKFDRS